MQARQPLQAQTQNNLSSSLPPGDCVHYAQQSLTQHTSCQTDSPSNSSTWQCMCTGVWCGVDQKVNAMLPQPMQSSRAGNFFRHLCVESTGTASFTMFAPICQATNITPFHQETKRRRSWNCGSGDFIVQPLSTADSVRSGCQSQQLLSSLCSLQMVLQDGYAIWTHMRHNSSASITVRLTCASSTNVKAAHVGCRHS